MYEILVSMIHKKPKSKYEDKPGLPTRVNDVNDFTAYLLFYKNISPLFYEKKKLDVKKS